ncbi:glutathione S-transferase family protein [bacterium]|nr:glutathione S-transferase family protein [bacterium]
MLKLYNSDLCPFAHRARLVVSAKSIEHDRIHIDLKNMPQWYRELSPNQSVPFIQHDEKSLPESLIIMQYLDEAFPGLKLTPEDAYGRAKMRLALDAIGSKLVTAISPAFRGPDFQLPADEELWSPLEASLDADGPFWLGAQLTLADLAAYPWFERWPLLQQRTGRALNLPPRLKRWLAAVSNLPAVLKEARSTEFYLEAMAQPAAR